MAVVGRTQLGEKIGHGANYRMGATGALLPILDCKAMVDHFLYVAAIFGEHQATLLCIISQHWFSLIKYLTNLRQISQTSKSGLTKRQNTTAGAYGSAPYAPAPHIRRRYRSPSTSKPAARTARTTASASWRPCTLATPVDRLTSTPVTPSTPPMARATAPWQWGQFIPIT